MKKTSVMMMAALALLLSSCEKAVFNDVVDGGGGETEAKETKNFTFTVKGDFGGATFSEGIDVNNEQGNGEQAARPFGSSNETTAYLQADGKDMTDLWVFDYVGGECVQQVHQVATDADFGKPQMSLAYGSHHVYFIASRGATPVLDTDEHTITWSSVRDTFAKDYEVSVVNTSNGNRAVTMDRIVTKLKVTGIDEVPATCATISVTPSQWFYGYDYVNDAPVASSNSTISLAVPSSYIGTTGLLSLGVFSISGTDEWSTSAVVRTATSADVTLGQATITDAPFLRNRSTEYSGNLFSSGGSMTISMNEDWLSPHVGEW